MPRTPQAALAAIAEPRRRAILECVTAGPRSAGAVARRFPDVTRAAISQHLRVLEGAGLVKVEARGTSRFYAPSPEGIEALRSWLDEFWRAQLARMKAGAERPGRKRP